MGGLEVQEVTHDELIAKLDDFNVALSNGFGDVKVVISSVNAIRAVVELHKPWSMETGPEGDSETETVIGCSCIPELAAFLNPYPCRTIQAIEKQLI